MVTRVERYTRGYDAGAGAGQHRGMSSALRARISYQRLSRLLGEVFGLGISEGALDAAFRRGKLHVDADVAAILARLRRTFYGKLDTVLKGRKTKHHRHGLRQGARQAPVRPSLVEGAEVRFNGHFSRGSELGAASRSASSNSAARPRTKPSRSTQRRLTNTNSRTLRQARRC